MTWGIVTRSEAEPRAACTARVTKGVSRLTMVLIVASTRGWIIPGVRTGRRG